MLQSKRSLLSFLGRDNYCNVCLFPIVFFAFLQLHHICHISTYFTLSIFILFLFSVSWLIASNRLFLFLITRQMVVFSMLYKNKNRQSFSVNQFISFTNFKYYKLLPHKNVGYLSIFLSIWWSSPFNMESMSPRCNSTTEFISHKESIPWIRCLLCWNFRTIYGD